MEAQNPQINPHFSWSYLGRKHWGQLVELSEFDKKEYANLKLKKGQILKRYSTDVMNGRMEPLIAINPERKLVYHLAENDSDSDIPVFETRGLKGDIYYD